MKKTSLLPPNEGVQMVWALTGKFAKDKYLRLSPSQVEEEIKNLKEYIGSGTEKDDEKRYVSRALVAMDASLRTIHTIYKGRDLNFDENESLRLASLKSAENSIEFGTRLKDFLKSLPTMTVGGVSGATIGQHFVTQYAGVLGIGEGKLLGEGSIFSTFYNILLESGILLWIMVVVGIVVGYMLNWLFSAWVGRRRQKLYFMQDYDRNLYYRQYLGLVREILKSLYQDLDQAHKDIFDVFYSTKGKDQIIEKILAEAEPRHCEYIDKHMWEKKITPELWPLCETGDIKNLGVKAVVECPHWKAERDKDRMTVNQKLWYIIRCSWMRIW